MSAPAAISGEFTTIKHVPSRKVYQLVIEVAEEAAQQAFNALGMPNSGSHVAVARLVEDARVKPEHTKERVPFTELPLAQQAAMRCQERDFETFLIDTRRASSLDTNADRVAIAVRRICGVKSRADIGKGPNDRSANDSGFKWRALDAEYYAWQRGRR